MDLLKRYELKKGKKKRKSDATESLATQLSAEGDEGGGAERESEHTRPGALGEAS